jgi:hypothetical protein
MNYEQAAAKYTELRDKNAAIDKKAKEEKAKNTSIMEDIAAWFAIKAQEEGLKTVPTTVGTAYWSTHHSATTAEPTVFKQFVIDNALWDLLETRPAKTAVKSYVEGHGVPPPGVNYSSIQVFNLRANHKE